MSADTNKLPAEVLTLPSELTKEQLDAAEKALGQWSSARSDRESVKAVWRAIKGACTAYDASPGPALEAENARLRAELAEAVELLHWALTAAERLAATTPKGFLRTGIEAKAAEIRTAIARAKGE